jgi:hypothetical protein
MIQEFSLILLFLSEYNFRVVFFSKLKKEELEDKNKT